MSSASVNQLKRRSLWGTRFGFYLAAIGSAFGLGNLWRFPYVVVENGGGAFVLLYILLALLVGLPMLIGELMLGKLTRRSVIGAVAKVNVGPSDLSIGSANLTVADEAQSTRLKKFVWVGRLAVIASLMVLSYYAVISGWVLHFFMQFFVSSLHLSKEPLAMNAEAALEFLRGNGWLQVALASVHILVTIIVVVKGVQEGIEKWVGNLMPLFGLLLIILVVKSLSLPSSTDALRYLLYPDFSKLTSGSLLHALGHVCFTLSIGFGTMVTFGSYLTADTHIPSAGFRVASVDTFISLFAGLLIFPIVMGFGFDVRGPEVLFLTLPKLVLQMEGGIWFGAVFFACLYIAALGASIGLLESIVSNWLDQFQMSRIRATWYTGGAVFVMALVPALSTSVFRNVTVRGRGLLEVLDSVLINGLLPLIALGLSIVVNRRLKADLKREEFVNDESLATMKLYSHWNFAMSYVVPVVVILGFALSWYGAIR